MVQLLPAVCVDGYWEIDTSRNGADRETMEADWASPEGRAATADLAEFADLSRTTWALVDFRQRR